jgi:hypothetical protein
MSRIRRGTLASIKQHGTANVKRCGEPLDQTNDIETHRRPTMKSLAYVGLFVAHSRLGVHRYLIEPRELGGLGLWRCLAWRDDAGRTCWHLAASGPAKMEQGGRFSRQLYQAWERGLRRELTTRETDAPPVSWIGGVAKHLLMDQ